MVFEPMTLKEYFEKYFVELISNTLYYVLTATIVAFIFGIILGVVLFMLRRSKKKVQKYCYNVLDFLVNMLRSFPFYILIFVLVPFTRVVMEIFTGRAVAISSNAFVVPLIIAAIPFFAKIIENALNEVNPQIIEAAQSLGLTWPQIITRVVIREALPAIVSGVTLGIITLFGYSALSGAVGGDSLGKFAYDHGVGVYDTNAIIYAVVTTIVIVEAVSIIGNIIYKKIK